MTKPFKITFCGDTSLGYYYLEKRKRKYPEAYERLHNDPFSFFEGVAPLLKGSDEVIVNLETVLTNSPGEPIEGKQYPGFDDPDITVDVLNKLGVTAVMLANNHAMDFGEQNLLEMIDFLHANGIATVGAGRNIAEARKPYTVTLPETGKKVYIINGMRSSRRYIEYGFFATKDKPGIANTRFSSVKRQIERIKSADPESTVVVCPHWQGIDYKDVDETKKQWCRDIVDAGADLIVGHGTHKKDIVEEYCEKKIYYSIGNFVFNSPGRYKAKGAEPFSMIVEVYPKLEKYIEKNIYTNNKDTEFNVKLVESREAENSISENKKISEVLAGFLKEEEYRILGNKDAVFSGTSIVTNAYSYSPNIYFIVGDDKWPKRLIRQQAEWGSDKTVKKALAAGFSNFVFPYSLADKFGENNDIKNAVFVEDTWSFFLQASKYIRTISDCQVIAVTGSAGKSTTCKMLEETISNSVLGKVYTTKGKNRNLFRDSVSSLSKLIGYKAAILEVSASNRFEKYDFYVSPNVAIFTSLAEAHLEHFKDLENIARIKSKIFMNMKNDDYAIINLDMPYASLVIGLAKKYSQANVVTYGESEASDIRLIKYQNNGVARVDFFGEEVEIYFNNFSHHFVLNAIAVIAAVRALGYDWKLAAKSLESFKALEGRGAVIDSEFLGKKITIVDDSYNSNISSLQAGLTSLANLTTDGEGRKIAIIGDILELGKKSKEIHEKLGCVIAESCIDLVILVGEEVSTAWKNIPQEKRMVLFPSYREVIDFLKYQIVDGDIIYLKASNSIGLVEVVAYLKSKDE